MVVVLFASTFSLAACPSADITGDCFVDLEDFAIVAGQWLLGAPCAPDPCVPEGRAFITEGECEMGDHHGEGEPDETPVHSVYVDSFSVSRYEITNQQYCDYLNSAYDASDIKVDLKLNHRKKGLLWYSTYKVSFSGKYRIANNSAQPREMFLDFRFPSVGTVYDNFHFVVG